MSMTDDDPTLSTARTQALIALARIELDDDPSTWPTSELRGEGLAVYAVHAASGGSRLG